MIYTTTPVDQETQKARAFEMGQNDARSREHDNPFPEGSVLHSAWRKGHASLVCEDCGGEAYDSGDPSAGYSGGPCLTCNGTGLEPEREEAGTVRKGPYVEGGAERKRGVA
jgi:hypothetical protein